MFHSSLPDSMSMLDIVAQELPEPQGHQQYMAQSNGLTSLDFEIHANQWKKNPDYEVSTVLLFKGIPDDMTEIEAITLCQPFGIIKDIFIKRQKRYAFLQFERLDQAARCYDTFARKPPVVRGYTLYVFCTGKDVITKASSLVTPPSRFLLFTFNTGGLSIETSLIAQLLAPYGRCVKIALFPTKNCQAFVEMEDVLQAIRIRESLDGQTVFNTVPIGVTYTEEKDAFYQGKSHSNVGLSTVATLDQITQPSYPMVSNNSYNTNFWNDSQDSSCIWPPGLNAPGSFQNNITSYRSETNIRPPALTIERMSSAPKENLKNMISQLHAPQENYPKTMNQMSPYMDRQTSSPYVERQASAPKESLKNMISQLNAPQDNYPNSMNQISPGMNQMSPLMHMGVPRQQSAPKDSLRNMIGQLNVTKDNVPKTMSHLSPLMHVNEEKSLTILLIKNLPKGVSARMLFRLFGMYGNVLKVKIFFKTPENALIEYQTPEQAELAKSYLNNCPVYGNNIFVTNSKQGVAIDTSALKKGEETPFMGDYTTSPEHRYKFSGSKNHLNIVPPSKVLHLSNLCEDKDEDFYIQLFRDYGMIRKFTFMKGMALMEMASIEDSVKILSNFHNFNIMGKYLKVSFSKYQKIKDI